MLLNLKFCWIAWIATSKSCPVRNGHKLGSGYTMIAVELLTTAMKSTKVQSSQQYRCSIPYTYLYHTRMVYAIRVWYVPYAYGTNLYTMCIWYDHIASVRIISLSVAFILIIASMHA